MSICTGVNFFYSPVIFFLTSVIKLGCVAQLRFAECIQEDVLLGAYIAARSVEYQLTKAEIPTLAVAGKFATVCAVRV
jgi:hypothetical protein